MRIDSHPYKLRLLMLKENRERNNAETSTVASFTTYFVSKVVTRQDSHKCCKKQTNKCINGGLSAWTTVCLTPDIRLAIALCPDLNIGCITSIDCVL